MDSDPLAILLRFDRWATRRILDVCQSLPDEKLDAEFAIGPGSLRKTLAHLASNMDWWIGIAHRQFDQTFDRGDPALQAIAARFERAWARIEAMLATPHATLAEVIEDKFDNPEYGKGTLRFRRSAVLLHLFNHGTHHRVQCLNMLRQLGVNPLPEIDLIDSHQEVERHVN